MKKISLCWLIICLCYATYAQDTTLLTPVEVSAIRAADNAPIAKTNLSREQLAARNTGQDLPFILLLTPGVVSHSDAGNGIGYTGLRIRGTDASRINFTINGIPYNDAESQGTFLVNIPDLVSSAGNIQIQRGVGTTSQGTGSFGGGVHISTNEVHKERALMLNNTFGSYGSMKNTLQFHSGLMKKKFLTDIRLSNIQSNGYIDRATSSLQSLYASVAMIERKQSLRLNIIAGREKTYQAWYGVDEASLRTNRTFNAAGTEKPGTPYDNETDNYRQTHYQLFYNRELSKRWKMNLTGFMTRGIGYYEQYKAGETLNDYQLPDYNDGTNIFTESDLVRRLYLDNYFFGNVFSFQHTQAKRDWIIGGGWNQYNGDHYGKVVTVQLPVEVPKNHRWYDNDAVKREQSLYTKWTERFHPRWQSYVDVQLRRVDYDINGFRNAPGLKQNNSYLFFNPKAGITYRYANVKWYAFVAKASKEPNRDDFEAGINETPRAETLYDTELGFEQQFKKGRWAVNAYYMYYRNQLVLTGKINDVGAYTRTNIPVSYRLGIELEGSVVLHRKLQLSSNVSISRNRIKNFTEYLDDYDNGGQITRFYPSGNLSFSPDVTGMWMLQYTPLSGLTIECTGKYVGSQYLDNTSNKNRRLDDYYVQDVRVAKVFKWKAVKELSSFIQVQNLFSTRYEPNGYTFSYLYNNNLVTENYYFPMAPIQVFAGVQIGF
ncbi:MAG TPA: TonB-dependent receptor [Ferruginibacter sp.]|nr:TonB-dependent receptor [Ferruginibacter sp.]HRO95711.1 TonB-dependent receptor [Ferruginibacter sp.]HRP49280.1 TonB-dependent receptor [Ferruginibacter sp.]